MCDLTQTNDHPMNQLERKCPVRLSICLALSLFACGDVGYAADVSITWITNSESDLAGYKVYKRILPSTDYGSPFFSGLPSNPASPQTTITNLLEGTTYGFIATAFDTSGNESVPSTEKQISIGSSGSGNQAPTVSAGQDQTITLPSGATLNGAVTDDGLPTSPGVVTTTWSVVSGPGTVTFGDATAVDTTVSFSVDGAYVLRLTGNDGALAPFDEIAITVNPAPGGGGTFPPPLSDPAPGSTLTTTSVTFTGDHTSSDLEHWLYVGTSVGANNLHDSGSLGTGHTTTVAGLPTSGTIHVRWFSKNSSGWQSQDYTYTMAVGDDGSTNAPIEDVAVWLMNGLTIGSTGIPGSAPSNWSIVGVGDMDGDSKADNIWRDTHGGAVAVWLGNGMNAPTTTGIIGSAPTTWSIVGIGDIDGDGKADIVWRDTHDGAVAVWLGNGISAPTTTGVIGGAPSNWSIVGIGDIDGDGKADIVWRDSHGGTVAVWLGNGVNESTTTGVIGGASTTWTIAGIGDMDGNGKNDIVWRHSNLE